MAVIEHTISYNEKNFDDLLTLVTCFISSLGVGTVESFEAQHENLKWRGTLVYRQDLADASLSRVTLSNRIEFQYGDPLLTQPLLANYNILRNGELVIPTSRVLIASPTNRLRLSFAMGTFVAADVVTASFCNSEGMNVGAIICTSFVERELLNIL